MRSTRRCLFDLILNLCLLILKNEEANNGGEADKISLATLIPVRRRTCFWSGDPPEADKLRQRRTISDSIQETFYNINLIKNQSF